MNRNPNRKEDGKSAWIGMAVSLMLVVPPLIPVAVLAGIFWLIAKAVNKPRSAPKTRSTPYTTRQASFDECPRSLFCRHKDKSEHHVRRGKEIDPWDRPDIDISKYQRNR